MNNFERALLASDSVRPLAASARSLVELSSRPGADLTSLVEVLDSDAGLGARIIRLANSPMNGVSRELDTVRQAGFYLGHQTALNFALALCFISALRVDRGQELPDAAWRFGLIKALGARCLGAATHDWHPDEAFLAGLLSSAGVLVLLQAVPEYGALLERFYAGEAELEALERDELQTGHRQLTPLLLHQWQLPARLIDPIRQHHGLLQTEGDTARRGQILACADRVARAIGVPCLRPEIHELEDVLTRVAIPSSRALAIATELPDLLPDAAYAFDLPGGPYSTYRELLEEASRPPPRPEPVEQVLSALPLARERGFRGLNDIGEPLQVDSGTGWLARSSFERILDNYHRRARQLHLPLSLVVFEIDNLKGIEAAKGVETARAILCAVATRMRLMIRASDPSGRVGEDRVAVLAPGCSPEDAPRMAERVRVGVEREGFTTSGGAVSVQVAIGTASSSPHHDSMAPVALMDAAVSSLSLVAA